MTLSGCATYGQLLLFVSLLIGILRLLRGVAARDAPLPGRGPRPEATRPAPLSVLRI
ncbi:hypothetical protein [Streptomyces sp. NBC_00893]|uniref:hypothetical protein n=1 Tax=Streptomyces sp. NBC_00893 TaxID=2975862 RepID=UPI0022514EAC|nr:hypothetical protein [Streptomyces sp. NBC_00893]MCX4848367.1 hypothetical protein [Streptomyces sp. NBC_00893]